MSHRRMKTKQSDAQKIAAHRERIAITHRAVKAGTLAADTGKAIITSCNKAIRRLKGE